MIHTNRPFEQFNRLREELDRAFSGVQARTSAYPPLNVWEDDASVYVEAELPGMKLDDLEILFEKGNELTIKGTRHVDSIEGGHWHRRERSHGQFARTISLDSEINVDAVTAELKHGVLTVTLPKSEAVKPRKINVHVSQA